jgi:hypothetical protein
MQYKEDKTMRELKFYCDLCKKEIEKHPAAVTASYQHGEDFQDFLLFLQGYDFTHLHLHCMKILLNEINKSIDKVREKI